MCVYAGVCIYIYILQYYHQRQQDRCELALPGLSERDHRDCAKQDPRNHPRIVEDSGVDAELGDIALKGYLNYKATRAEEGED